MTSIASEAPHLAAGAFDTIADSYDSIFTDSLIGRSQRAVVWSKAASVFRAGDRVLELNCGTGEDALFLARQGVSVVACDASPRMVEQAQARLAREALPMPVAFHVLRSEHLGHLPSDRHFDGVFSNFSGLNCTADLAESARLIAARLKIGAQALLCLSTRFCAWEILHYLLRGDFHKAFRRCGGSSTARLGAFSFPVYYPTLHSLLNSFHPMFRLRSVTGVGVTVPPSYMENWAERNPRLMRFSEAIDRSVANWPGLRLLGDHMLLHLEKVE